MAHRLIEGEYPEWRAVSLTPTMSNIMETAPAQFAHVARDISLVPSVSPHTESLAGHYGAAALREGHQARPFLAQVPNRADLAAIDGLEHILCAIAQLANSGLLHLEVSTLKVYH